MMMALLCDGTFVKVAIIVQFARAMGKPHGNSRIHSTTHRRATSCRGVLLVLVGWCFATASDLQPGSLPNPSLTPGDTVQSNVSEICAAGYTKAVRSVSAEVKRRVYLR